MLRCSFSTIEEIHEQLAAGFRPYIAENVQIVQPLRFRDAVRWKQQDFEGEILFDLLAESRLSASPPLRGRPVVELSGTDAGGASAWVSWHEKWTKLSKDRSFTLESGNFGFYWGRPLQIDAMLFRAEWPNENCESKTSGHPHWQFDIQTSGLSIKRMHFAMGGWNSAKQFPACWRRFPNEKSELRAWAVATIQYARTQIIEYPPTGARG